MGVLEWRPSNGIAVVVASSCQGREAVCKSGARGGRGGRGSEVVLLEGGPAVRGGIEEGIGGVVGQGFWEAKKSAAKKIAMCPRDLHPA